MFKLGLNNELWLILIINCAGSTHYNGRNEKLKSCLFEIIDNIKLKGKESNFAVENTVIVLGDSGVRQVVGFNTLKSITEANFEPFGIMSMKKALDEIKTLWNNPQYSSGSSIASIVLLSDGVFDYEADLALEAFNLVDVLKDIPRLAVCSDIAVDSDEYQNISKFAGNKIFDTYSAQNISNEITSAYLNNRKIESSSVPELDDEYI